MDFLADFLPSLKTPFTVLMLAFGVGLVSVLVLLVLRRRKPPAVSPRQQATQHLGLLGNAGEGGDSMAEVGTAEFRIAEAPPRPRPGLRQVERALAKAKASGDDENAAALYLLAGHGLVAEGHFERAEAQFRQAVLLSSKLQLVDLHAAARLELGDLAHQSGDLTTACEHWQMARGLFHKLDARGAIKETDQRMQGNGCPTDWVLTEF